MSQPGRCRECRSNFTGRSREDVKDAPGWKDECPACTKKKFMQYLSGYAIKLLSPRGMAMVALEYFEDAPADLRVMEAPEQVAAAVGNLVLSRHAPRGSKPPATTGLAISGFVSHVDGLIDVGNLQPSRLEGRRGMLLLLAAGIALVSLALVLALA